MTKLNNKNNHLPHWIQKMLPDNIESHFYTSKKGRIHYLKCGKGKQVVMVHGNPTWSFLWRNVIKELDLSKYEVIVPDLMNLGFSDSLPHGEFTLTNHVDVIAEFFNSIVRERSILVVQDWGGPIGLLASMQVPNLFEKFVALNTALDAPKIPLKLSSFHRFSFLPIIPEIVFFCFKFPLPILKNVQSDPSSISGDVARAYRYPIKGSKRLSALWYARLVPSSELHPSFQQLKILGEYVKTLKKIKIVWGMKDPILGKNIFHYEKHLKTAFISKHDAGHFLQEEIPNEIANAITNP